MSSEWNRLTARGGDEVENVVTGMLKELRDRLKAALPPDSCRSVVLLGGYGRGEGGVLCESEKEKPHNNFDLLFITRQDSSGTLRDTVDKVLAPLRNQFGIGIDPGYISANKLQSQPCLVMWYDMRFGHKVLLGDESFVAGLEQFRVEAIEPSDVLSLLINRGALFLINDLILSRNNNPRGALRRMFVKHAMKGIIGYGDALLFFLGNYHWSYVEKQERMKQQTDVDAGFRRLYDEAMEFRFRPDYRPWEERDLAEWRLKMTPMLEKTHLQVESARLGDLGGWQNYHNLSLEEIWKRGSGVRKWARKARAAVRGTGRMAGSGSWSVRLGALTAEPRERLNLLFPYVAYPLPDTSPYARWASHELDGADRDRAGIAFLRWWGETGDTNFWRVLEEHGIGLED